MIFNSKRQSGKSMYIAKRAIQYHRESLKGKGAPPLIIVPTASYKRFMEQLIYKLSSIKDIPVVPISTYILRYTSFTCPKYRVLMDEAQSCLYQIINYNAELTDCTLTVPTFDNPCKELLKEI